MFFTKTEWNEPPRLRHQLANLLIDRGHEVLFFQKSRISSSREKLSLGPSLTLLRHPHILHHQLKFLTPIRLIDELFLKQQIQSLVTVENGDVIVNFNYDFYFLSDIFPRNPIIHVVNDDFPAAAIMPNKGSASRLQARTARDADHSLCVSYLLTDQIRRVTPECSLFLPWARHKYTRPTRSVNRTEMLFWGYINERFNFELVDGLLESGITINFFGHVTPGKQVDSMLAHENAIYHGLANLQNIPEVLKRCSCTLLPYDASDETIKCITMNNRGFELLSFGLPLLYTKLPQLIAAPDRVIYRCTTIDDFLSAYEDATRNFDHLQDEISSFLQFHYPENRYEQFIGIVNSVILRY